MSELKDIFLDEFQSLNAFDGKSAILNLLAQEVLGDAQLEKLNLRYKDMSNNFDNVSRNGLATYRVAEEWVFSKGVEPHRRENTTYLYYSDTTSVPIPITHDFFSHLRNHFITNHKDKDQKIDGAVIALDLPTWFNLSSDRRIMIIAQDPLRDPKWYYECEEAICSTPFGMHSREHRDRGGRRMNILISELTSEDNGCCVYLTDAHKFYLCGWSETEKKKVNKVKLTNQELLSNYRRILLKEISIVQPSVIVTFGQKAKKMVHKLLNDTEVLNLPHFSGTAQGYIINSSEYKDIKNEFGISETDNSIKVQARVYTHAILNNISFNL